MFKKMNNREFSDWLADAALNWEAGSFFCVSHDTVVAALREASQRIKSDAEYQFDVRAAHRPHPCDPKGDGSFEGPDGAK